MPRLPVYAVLDISGSMVGVPIQAVNQGLRALLSDLQSEPYALETAFLSIITFQSTAQQLFPLTEIANITPPTLVAGGGTSLGQALDLLTNSLNREVQRQTATQIADYRPLVFIMSDGKPTDAWEAAATRLRQSRPANIIACAAGAGADVTVLKSITADVVKLDNLQPATLAQFFKWVTASIKQVSIAAYSNAGADNNGAHLAPFPATHIVP